MKLNHKIEINLLDFIKTGKFDYVTIGHTKEWITANFPEPDFKTKSKNKSSCWGYGKIEFWFVDERLNMIFTDHLEYLDAGSEIELDKSIFSDQNVNKLNLLQSKLNESCIDYQIQHKTNLEQIIITITQSKVELRFGFHDEKTKIDDYELFSIALKSDS